MTIIRKPLSELHKPDKNVRRHTDKPVSYTHLDVYKRQVWSDMKAHFGRKYVTEADLREYHVHTAWNATLMLLDD